MSKALSELNGLRRGRPAHHVESMSNTVPHRVSSAPLEALPETLQKPKGNLLMKTYREQLRKWKEVQEIAYKRTCDHQLELSAFVAETRLKNAKNEVECHRIANEAQTHALVAQAVAQMNQRAVAEAMNSGKNVVLYGTHLIQFIDREEIDPELAEYYKSMVRRLARFAMVDWESGAIGEDFDPTMLGGAK